MKYFSFFPKIAYPTKIASNGVRSDFVKTANLMLSVKFREKILNNTVFFYDYVVSDDDRPDIIASKYYGSADYAWLIFLVNETIDPTFDWPLTHHEFILYLKEKYGTLEYTHQNIKKYFNASGYEIDFDTWDALPVSERDSQTIYEWETQLNENKRNIKLLEDIYLNKVLSEFRELMQETRDEV